MDKSKKVVIWCVCALVVILFLTNSRQSTAPVDAPTSQETVAPTEEPTAAPTLNPAKDPDSALFKVNAFRAYMDEHWEDMQTYTDDHPGFTLLGDALLACALELQEGSGNTPSVSVESGKFQLYKGTNQDTAATDSLFEILSEYTDSKYIKNVSLYEFDGMLRVIAPLFADSWLSEKGISFLGGIYRNCFRIYFVTSNDRKVNQLNPESVYADYLEAVPSAVKTMIIEEMYQKNAYQYEITPAKLVEICLEKGHVDILSEKIIRSVWGGTLLAMVGEASVRGEDYFELLEIKAAQNDSQYEYFCANLNAFLEWFDQEPEMSGLELLQKQEFTQLMSVEAYRKIAELLTPEMREHVAGVAGGKEAQRNADLLWPYELIDTLSVLDPNREVVSNSYILVGFGHNPYKGKTLATMDSSLLSLLCSKISGITNGFAVKTVEPKKAAFAISVSIQHAFQQQYYYSSVGGNGIPGYSTTLVLTAYDLVHNPGEMFASMTLTEELSDSVQVSGTLEAVYADVPYLISVSGQSKVDSFKAAIVKFIGEE